MNKFTSIRSASNIYVKEIQVLEDVMWMEDLVELRKLHTVAWRVLCQWESKPVYAPDLAQELEAVLPMEDNILREIGEDGTSTKHDRMI